ncbi:DJ-1/PfpI family protein [Acidovorax sp. GBBC 3334]|uniref:DJ-1/PfpI family protein n=1 Tax=Acidovorax sp. GBBC 3334 TaxID=2940496 RepID=UPI0023023678|nr:DJ-1/PfpI family protein [Acidovorax sp. GBBC 3334]MDA8453301.1 DJ-1/PfpI family protein [Acidovorax sp. GBBC 3334]
MATDTLFPRTQRIGILVFPDFEPLDVWGFIEAFSIARFIGTSYTQPPGPCPFEIVLISNECRPAGKSHKEGAGPGPVRSFNGPRVAPDLYRDEALEQPLDLLMVPGGRGVNLLMEDEGRLPALLDWLRAMDGHVSLLTSVCTGAALLARSGVLDGQPAATNHQAFGWVTGFGPKVLWDNTSRWVDAGRHVTSAGVSAGTDMAWHLVSRLAGRAVAETAALAAEYDWHRDPSQPIFYPQQAAVPSGS